MLRPPSHMRVTPITNAFGETCQTYYDPQKVPLARWGVRYCQDPNNLAWKDESNPYRTCCTSHTWVGSALAARILKLESNLNHPAFFDYVDRWVSEGGGFSSTFVKDMWLTYRGAAD